MSCIQVVDRGLEKYSVSWETIQMLFSSYSYRNCIHVHTVSILVIWSVGSVFSVSNTEKFHVNNVLSDCSSTSNYESLNNGNIIAILDFINRRKTSQRDEISGADCPLRALSHPKGFVSRHLYPNPQVDWIINEHFDWSKSSYLLISQCSRAFQSTSGFTYFIQRIVW
jgi:hypothetical protein